ncbi:MAG: 3-oxoacid CoA-transferase subunit B [Bacillus sp. (in: firmicutes)]
MGMEADIRQKIARRAAEEVHHRMIVNLGIGIPSLVPDFIEDKETIFFQAENGILGLSDKPEAGQEDENLCNAGGLPVTLRIGGCYFDSVEAFAMIRKGKIDLTILGALQVSPNGDLANWIVPGKKVPGMGGAMELAAKAKCVIVTMNHCDKNGRSKIVKQCDLPLTAKNCVSMIITEMAVFSVANGELTLMEHFHPFTIEDVRKATEANFAISENVSVIGG